VLFNTTKASIVVAGVIGGIVVNSGIDYVNLVTLVFFIKAALIFPLGLAIFWPRMTAKAFTASLILAVGAGLPLRQTGHELAGIITLEAVSLVVAVGLSLLERGRFDYTSLARSEGELEVVHRLDTGQKPLPTHAPAPEPAAG
jgi:urea-proton symporter